MGNLKSSGIIYQAQYFEETVSVQVGGQNSGMFSKITHTTSSIQTTADVVPLDTATKEILERNKQLLAKMGSENVRKSYNAIDYSVVHAKDDMFGLDSSRQIEESVDGDDNLKSDVNSDNSIKSGVDDDIWGIGEHRQIEESVDEDDSIFNFDGVEDNDSKKFEDFSTLMGKRAGKNAKKDKRQTRYGKGAKSKFRKRRMGDFRSKFPKRLRRKTKRSRKEKPSSTKENDLAFKAGIRVLKQDMPVRIIVGIIAGIAFIAIVLLRQVW